MSILSLVLPVVITINNFVITIDNNTLKTIETTEEFSSELNLSSLGLRNLEINAFANVTTLRSLDLANNSLENVPEFIFANFTNLEILSIASNNISSFKNVFNGLRTLKSLNITDNPQQRFWDSAIFVGINDSCDIWTRGTFPKFLKPNAFHYYPPRQTFYERRSGRLNHSFKISSTFSIWNLNEEYHKCITDGVLQSLQVSPSFFLSVPGCTWVNIFNPNEQRRGLNLSHLGIVEFDSSWYRVQSVRVGSIDLSWNNVAHVSSELLNDLPFTISNVSLAWNKIERLEKGVIDNQWIEWLDLSNNFISVIDNDALKKTNLTALILNGNRLTDIKFASTLPFGLLKLHVNRNKIDGIADRSFRKIGKLVYLDLGGNCIMELRSLSLKGLTRLEKLVLHENRLRKIEPGAFQDLASLTDLDICCNSIAIIEKGAFLGLKKIQKIKLTGNKLTRIGKDFLFGIRSDLKEIMLDFNAIEIVEVGSFVKGPSGLLSLGNNRISKIEKGTFGVPKVEANKSKNNKTVNSFEDFFKPPEIVSGLTFLWLTNNNRIKRLENGALFGMEKSARTEVNCLGINIELIQPGVFDDL